MVPPGSLWCRQGRGHTPGRKLLGTRERSAGVLQAVGSIDAHLERATTHARIHFDLFAAKQGRFGKRLIYGGHVISLARSLSFNGLANAFHIAGVNGGRHVAPLFAGGTVFAWSEVLAKAELPGRNDVGALRLRTVATNDKPCGDFPFKTGDDYDPAVLLDLDYWVLMPR